MARYDFRTQRLFVEAPLNSGADIALDRNQQNYLLNVLRMRDGNPVLVFNGIDGEWLTTVSLAGKKKCILKVEEQTRQQTEPYLLRYLFAPLKTGRLDYMVQKAVEMGVGQISPVITHHTQNTRLKKEKLLANAIEAAEQCGILNIPRIDPVIRFDTWLADWASDVPLIFCDEHAKNFQPEMLKQIDASSGLAVFIGPEGGFSPVEREQILAKSNVVPISLGPRILRADTAAVAALALIQSQVGDWNMP